MKLRFASLGSGSGGNSYCLSLDGFTLMIDCGFSCREMVKRCRANGVDPRTVFAVVLTHSHDDHVRGVKGLRKILPWAKFYASDLTAEAVAARMRLPEDDFLVFEKGQAFDAGPFSVRAFPVPHDTPDCSGYVVETHGFAYFHATDVGQPLDSIGDNFALADLATLEFNHDPTLLATSKRPRKLKRRIKGPSGHLSNFDAASLVGKFASPRLKKVFLAHISRECNSPHLAEEEFRRALEEAGKPQIPCECLSQTDGASWETEIQQ